LFVADFLNGRVRRVDAGGMITTVAGNGSFEYNGDGILAISAGMSPNAVAVDASGNLLIADADNHRIRRVTPDGIVSTVAGTGYPGYSGDGGQAISAELFLPLSVVVDSAGNLFISDSSNARVRKVDSAGVITTVAGDGSYRYNGDGGPAVSAAIGPLGIAVDAAGNIFIADYANERVRKVTPAGIISTVAGTGARGAGGDGGPAAAAELRDPAGVAVDSAGNLYIADTGNERIRRVAPDGVIETIAGTGQPGFGGDGGPATSAQFSMEELCMIATDAAGNLFVPDFSNNRVRKITFTQIAAFALVDRGGVSSASAGSSPALHVGYAAIQPAAGSVAPAGLAIFGFRQNSILVSEAGVPASPAIRSGRIYAEVNGPVNTGIALANPNDEAATVSFYFSNSSGDLGHGATTIPANTQIAAFLNQPPFKGPSALSGTFTFTSTMPLAVIALRGFSNERGEFLITTLPVADLTAAAGASTVFPHFADGGGWTTQIVLVNPVDSVQTGAVQLFDQQGAAATLAVNGQSGSSFTYSIPARSSQKLQTAGTASSVMIGSVRVVPASGTSSPSGLVIFSYRNSGITVTEAGVAAVAPGNAFRLYAEVSGPVQTGIAVVNTSSNSTTVTLEATRLDGSFTGSTGTLTIPANGQTAVFLNQVPALNALATPFQGVLRLSSSAPVSVTGIRGRYNERGDFLITTTSPVNEATAQLNSTLYFPHIADSGGYTTQFILFSALPGSAPSGTIQFFSQTGGALHIKLQ
jgi:sugar lactone lactonase YvrE